MQKVLEHPEELFALCRADHSTCVFGMVNRGWSSIRKRDLFVAEPDGCALGMIVTLENCN